MKTGSYLVNTSRGPIIDIPKLIDAISAKKFRGAALDVLPEEPPPYFDTLRAMPSLLLTPHIAFYSETSIIELRTSIAEQVVEVMQGKAPKYNVYKLS